MPTKKPGLVEIMRENPMMPVSEAQDKYFARFKEHVSTSLINQVRDELTGRKPKPTTRELRAIQFISDNPLLTTEETCRAYEERYGQSLSRSFYYVCKNKLYEKEQLSSIETIIKRARTPKVIEGIRLHKIVLLLGGLKQFEALLSDLEAFGSLKRVRSVLEAIRSALEEDKELPPSE